MRRYYELLDISEDATPEEIQKAYKKAASLHHPDKNIGNEEEATLKFQEMKKAYECLSDPEKREKYDRGGPLETDSDPVQNLLVHILNEILEHHTTVDGLLQQLTHVCDQMSQEIREKMGVARRDIGKYSKMMKAVNYTGGQINLIQEVIREKHNRAGNDLTALESSLSVVVQLSRYLQDYKAMDRDLSSQEKFQQMGRFSNLWGPYSR